jgi:hypothetical protein
MFQLSGIRAGDGYHFRATRGRHYILQGWMLRQVIKI